MDGVFSGDGAQSGFDAGRRLWERRRLLAGCATSPLLVATLAELERRNGGCEGRGTGDGRERGPMALHCTVVGVGFTVDDAGSRVGSGSTVLWAAVGAVQLFANSSAPASLSAWGS